MGRPKSRAITGPKYKKCGTCPPSVATKPVSAFYKSTNPMHLDGYMPICKECMMDLVYDPLEHKVSLQKLRKLLFQLDKPYIERVNSGRRTQTLHPVLPLSVAHMLALAL